MRILAIETASEACSVALYDDDELIAHDHRVLGRGHAEQLVPMIAALPDRGKADRIVVSLGPGSFTGLRIGIATARALGVAWGAEVLGYPTLALVAARAAQSGHPSSTVCMNGGHGEWFVVDYVDGAAQGEARSLTPDQARIAGARPAIAGNRAIEFAQQLGGENIALDILPDARAIHLLDGGQLTDNLAPIYGRAPDATPQSAAQT